MVVEQALLWESSGRQYNVDDIINQGGLHDTVTVCGIGQRRGCINLTHKHTIIYVISIKHSSELLVFMMLVHCM